MYYTMSQIHLKIPLIATFLGQSLKLLQKSKKYMLKCIPLQNSFPDWDLEFNLN